MNVLFPIPLPPQIWMYFVSLLLLNYLMISEIYFHFRYTQTALVYFQSRSMLCAFLKPGERSINLPLLILIISLEVSLISTLKSCNKVIDSSINYL